jgi:hypothetical protein
MNTKIDSDDVVKDDAVSEGNVGLTVVGGIIVFLFAWFVPSIGVLLGLALLAAIAIAVIILGLTFLIAACEAIFTESRKEARPQTVQIKRRAVGI